MEQQEEKKQPVKNALVSQFGAESFFTQSARMETSQMESTISGKQTKTKKVGIYKLHLDQVLGTGSFAKVYLGETDPNPKNQRSSSIQSPYCKYAIKEISNQILLQKLGAKGLETLKKEVDIQKLLNHVNIVRLHDYTKTLNNNYLVFEYCRGGDLRGFLKEKGRLQEPIAQRFMRQIASALKYLYIHNIIHRDLKPQNILLTEKTENAILKIADFGLARRYETKEDLFETTCGTPIYMAPELQRQEKYTEKADLWSVGVIMFELIVGFPPFIAANREQLKKAIENGKIRFPDEVRDKLSPMCLNLIELLLQQNVGTRIEWKDFFDHPFVTSDSNSYLVYYKSCLQKDQNSPDKISAAEAPVMQPVQRQEKPLQDNSQNPVENVPVVKEVAPVIEPLKKQQASKVSENQRYNKKDSQDEQEPTKIESSPIKSIQTSPKEERPQQIQPEKQICQVHSNINVSDSLTEEDLEETIEDVKFVTLNLLKLKAEQAWAIIEKEVHAMLTLEDYEFESQLKFLIYKVVQELKNFLIIFSQKPFTQALKVDPTVLQKFHAKYTSNKRESQSQISSLRVYTIQPKEIHLTPFLLQRLAVTIGPEIVEQYHSLLDLYQKLTGYITDFSILVQEGELNFNTLTEDLMHYGLTLCKQGLASESLEDLQKAKDKYCSARYVIDELSREFYHSLKFSNDENQSSDSANAQKRLMQIGDPQLRVKSFTFDVGHQKLCFSRSDEQMISSVQRMIKQRLMSNNIKQL